MIFVALGSNLDEPARQLDQALAALASVSTICVQAVSSYWQTPPWGPVPQPDYLNAVCRLESLLEPQQLLDCLLDIENRQGRERRVRWGPRRIDLDLLACGQQRVHSLTLELPHPRLAERAFVLVPWAELNPDFCPWVDRPPVAELLARLPAADRVACRSVRVRQPV